MDKQLLIYENAVPVSKLRHENFSVDIGEDFSFAKEINAVPAMTAEFSHLAREFPIGFAKSGSIFVPVALLGLRDEENLYVAEDGLWDGRYIPAFLRRYPFVFSKKPNEDAYVLCIDEAFGGVNSDDRGQRLFEKNGEETNYLKDMLSFVTKYQREVRRTETFCKTLSDLGVFSAVQVNFEVGKGKNATTGGIFSVDREKLQSLSKDTVKILLESGDLELAHAQMLSLGNVDSLVARMKAWTMASRSP
ncbi:SapC family protein [Ruegeria arenilitoris]|uniref:SapC family protein n=1 Tax=Ruegeria arenilitoris TaxID=1173585 RepID=UPI001479C4E3|nr:SapC family protein [Ruegeria arenilitoris]